jgi:hypothetical protein
MALHRNVAFAGTVALLVTIGAVSASSASADPAGAQSDLVAVTGQGSGLVIVSPTNHDGGAFDARVTVNIHDAAPNTTFAVTRTADGLADGVCTGTVFAQVGTLATSPGGAGAVEFDRTGPLLAFDLMLRVVGTDGSVLESSCMTIRAK